MNNEFIRVADVDLKVSYKWGKLRLTRDFQNAQGMPDAAVIVDVGYTSDGSLSEPEYSGKLLEISLDDNDGDGFNNYHLFAYLGFLAGDVSENFRYCHGAGLNYYGKGILLLGGSGSGKSTLASVLDSCIADCNTILDDDMLMVSKNKIMRIAKIGAKINRHHNIIEYIEDDNYECSLDHVFLLKNESEQDHFKRIGYESIKAEDTFDARLLHESLFYGYRKRMPIAFDVPIYEIGTKGHREDSSIVTKIIDEIVRG